MSDSPNRFELLSIPTSRQPVSLLSVDRAVSDLRRGLFVVIQGAGGSAVLAQAAEGASDESLDQLARTAGSAPTLSITGRRAAVLDLARPVGKVVTLSTTPPLSAAGVYELSDPLVDSPPSAHGIEVEETETYDCENAAVSLAKIARLLPAVVTAVIADSEAEDLAAWAGRHDLLLVDAGDIFQYENVAARTLRKVSEARVPLADAEQTRIIAFRPLDGGLEHLAIMIGEPDPAQPVLVRLHSECFTGDLLGSLRCDCGDQLRGAIDEISAEGAGVLLYLAQEGRGIGLVNKLRAYELQDRGFDTMDANEQLGFDADERVYLPAARMLRQLGFSSVRLLTNNPQKVEALGLCGVTVVERVAHAFPANKHNEMYLQTKKAKGGHLI